MTAPFAHPPQRGHFTPRTEGVVKIWENANERERSVLGDMHEHYAREVQRLVDDGVEPQSIAHTIHKLVDDSVRDTRANHPDGKRVSCRRGCGHCCTLHVNITSEEAELLRIVIERDRIEIDERKLERQAQWNVREWREQPIAERRCIFLSKRDECRVYEHRPTVCRKYMVVSAPKHCDTVRYPDGQVAILAPIEGEFLASAVLGVLDSGSLPRMLQEAMQ